MNRVLTDRLRDVASSLAPAARALLLVSAFVLGGASSRVGAQDLAASNSAIDEMRTAAGGGLTVSKSTRTGLATFVAARGGAGIPIADPSAISPSDRALSFVESYGRAFGLRSRSDVSVERINTDDLGIEHVRMRQVVSGVPVTGGEIVVHMRGDRVLAAGGKTLGDLDNMGVIPAVASNEAENTVREFASQRLNAPDAVLSEPRLEIFNQGLLNGRDFPTRLAWFVEVRGLALREFFWIDARSKTVLLHFSQLTDAKNRAIYTAANSPNLTGTLVRSEGGAATGDPDADFAYDFSGHTYDYYFTNHGRDSFDGAGAQLRSLVHYCEPPNCPNYPNAFWNGVQMVYGNGFASADDVVAHELTHAVTERTANLFYYMQSGALNESFSDIFGETVDLGNGAGNDGAGVRWQMGEDLTAIGGAIRNMMTPTLFNDPGKMSDSQFKCEIAPTAEDAGGVHTNSGVPNHAYALMVDGGTYNSITVAGIGLAKAGKIQYRALTQYLTSASDFLDNYNALQQACADLVGTIGITSGDCAEVKKSLDAVQMSNVWPCSPTQATPPALCSAGQVPVNLFFDNFESGLGNWSIAEPPPTPWRWWSRASSGGIVYATSGVDSMWGYDTDVVGDARVSLASNLPTIPSGARLQFNHSFGFDMGASINYDGGVLEYSTDGGVNWSDASGLYAAGANYAGAIAYGSCNPLSLINPTNCLSGELLPPRQAFVRQSYGYTASQYSLSALAGQTSARFRFRIGSDNSPGFEDYGWFIDDFRVYTCVAPAVWTGVASEITNTSATLNGTVNPNGVATSGSFEYGLTSSYGSTTSSQGLGSGTSVLPLTASITGLTACTTYHFRATAQTAAGATNGLDSNFMTAGCQPPTVTTGVASGITDTNATMNGTLNPNGTAASGWFEYGLTTSYGFSIAPQALGSGTAPVPFASPAFAGSLSCNTTYHFRAVGANPGGTTYGSDATFTTAACPSATVQTFWATNGTTSSVTLSGTVNPRGSTTNALFEYGTSAAYGLSTAPQNLGAGFSLVAPTAAINGLTCGTRYHFRISASNSGGTSKGADATFLTTACDNNVSSMSLLGPIASQLQAGYGHSCVVTTTGGVKCWGLNTYGQLGDGSTTSRNTPVDVSGLTTGVVSVATRVGSFHTCALTTSGGVKCWGRNNWGQLGDGTTTDRSVPADVNGLTSGVVQVSAGDYSTCALTSAGGVKCWGNGPVGDGTSLSRATPVDVVGLTSGVKFVAVGGHFCAVTIAGAAKCWGNNANGQLGTGGTTNALTPIDVVGLGSGVATIAPGDFFTCALTSAGGGKCWGFGGSGRLGDGTTTDHFIAADVTGLTSGVKALTTGVAHACAVTVDGAMKCWGLNAGTLGDGTGAARSTPTDVSGLGAGVEDIALGWDHTCAIMKGGAVKCWGATTSGQLGSGVELSATVPTPQDVAVISAAPISMGGTYHTCALTSAGGVKCWGQNSNGQIGDGIVSTSPRPNPVDVVGLTSGVASVFTGTEAYHSCAVTEGGALLCWGYNFYGQLGDGTTIDRYAPVSVTGLSSGVKSVTNGQFHTCALTAVGGVKCWGFNYLGVLGDGTLSNRSVPTNVVGLTSGVIALAAGGGHNCAVLSDGTVRCWGRNGEGQLGDGTRVERWTPVPVPGLSGVVGLSLGGHHSCAVTATGAVKCWGYNFNGQLGDGTTTDRLTPADVLGISDSVAFIGAGENHTCAQTTTGGAWCWGANSSFTLGDGTNTPKTTPVSVAGLTTGVASLMVANFHGCAVTTGGAVKCWGSNDFYALGDGTLTPRAAPVPIRSAQAISLSAPSTIVGNASLSPLATSGLAVVLDTWTPGVCSVGGGSVTATAGGLCGIRASQTGDGNNAAAPQNRVWISAISAPAVATGVATGVSAFQVTLNGTVNPNGATTTASFEIGLTTAYGGSTLSQSLGSGISNVPLGATVTGLTCATTYHFRARATNTVGSVNGSDATFTTTPCFTPVQWTHVVGVVATGNSLAKTSGTAAWDAGAISVQTLSSGNGQVEFTATETTTNRMLGLGNGDTNQSFTDIEYAIFVAPGGYTVFESGTSKTAAAPYAAGDKFSVGVESGVVKYRRNGVLFYTSLIPPTYPLVVDTTLFTVGATLTDAKVTGFIEPPPTLTINDVSVTEGNAGSVNAVFTVTLSSASLSTVTVVATTANNTALAGSDYTATGPTTLTFSPSVTTQTFTVPVLGDTATEPNESFLVNLSGATNAAIADAQGIGTILNDDLPPPVQWTHVVGVVATGNSLAKTSGTAAWDAGAISVQTLASGDGQVEFTATETSTNRMLGLGNGDSNQGFADIEYAIFVAPGGYMVFESGTSKTASAPYVAGDKFSVGVESGVVKYRRNGVLFYSSLIAPAYPLVVDTTLFTVGATLTNVRVLGFIEPPPTITINDVAVTEGPSGSVNAVFTVTLSSSSLSTVTVVATTADSTALAGSDYTATGPTTLTFTPGVLTQTFTVPVLGDTATEPNESFFVNLTSPTGGAVISDAQGIGTILNDDLPPPVQWTHVVGVVATGNSLAKTSGTAAWDAGAISVQTLASGDGQVEFTATETSTNRMLGLGNGDSNQGFADIEYAIFVAPGGYMVFESGTSKTASAPYVAGDKFSVGVESGVVKYRRNGVLFYSSLVAPVYPLVVDTTLFTVGATLTDVRVLGFIEPPPTITINDVAVTEGPSGSVNAVFTVTLSSSSLSTVTVVATTTDNTALAGSDYTTTGPTTLTFSPSVLTQTFTVPVLGDTATEPNESFFVNLSGATNAAIADAQGIGTILNDDLPPPVQWTHVVGVVATGNSLARTSGTAAWDAGAISVQTLSSGDGQVEFTATETSTNRMLGLGNGDTNQSFTDIEYAIFVAPGGYMVFESGTSKTASAPYAAGDKFSVGVESGVVKYRRNGVLFYSSLIAPVYPLVVDTTLFTVGATLTNVRVLGFIEPPPTLSINDVSVTEFNSGSANAVFTATLSSASLSTVTVVVATTNNTALAGSDYTATGPTTLTFAPGDLTQTFSVPVLGDTATEPNESFFVNLTGATNAAIADAQGVGTILNDDLPPPVQWTHVVGVVATGNSLAKTSGTAAWDAGAISVQALSSGDGQVEFTATETSTNRMLGLGNGDTNQSFTDIEYAIFVAPGGYTVFESGTSKTAAAPYAAGDKFSVGVESGVVKYRRNGVLFYSSLIAPVYPLVVDTTLFTVGATLTDARVLGFIEPPPTLTINDVSVTEGNAGSVNAVFTVTLSSASLSTVTVVATTTDNTALAGSDYTTTGPTTLTFSPSVLTQTFTVPVLGDTATEPNESFFVNLSGATNAAIADAQGIGTILNDDLPPPVQWTHVVGVVATGNSLARTSGTAAWDAGAISVQTLPSGDGQVEFTATETTTNRMLGLGNGDTNQSFTDIEYAIFVAPGGYSVFESGTSKTAAAPYIAGDKFSVGVESGVVKYRRNGVLFYSSLIAPAYPLVVDTTLFTVGATLTDVRVLAFVGPPIP